MLYRHSCGMCSRFQAGNAHFALFWAMDPRSPGASSKSELRGLGSVVEVEGRSEVL